MSLINFGGGLSAAGSSIASFAGAAGIAQQKADLEKQNLELADQLKDASDVKMAGINQSNALARIPVQGQQDIATAQATQGAKGAADIATQAAANQLPLSDAQIATNKIQQQEADAKTMEAKKPVSGGYTSTFMVPDSTSPLGWKFVNSGGDAAPITIDKNSANLSEQTGLTSGALNYASGQTKGRASPAQVAQWNKEINEYGIANHLDTSTLIPQATAVNKVLEANIERNNQGTILEKEIAGSIDNAKDLAKDVDLGSLKVGNLAAYWAGQQVNDPNAVKVGDQLSRLRDELANYNAVAGGHLKQNGTPQPVPEDFHAAEATISNGISSGGLQALGQSVAMSASKNRAVLQDSIDNANKQFHALFGQEYHPPARPSDQAVGTAVAPDVAPANPGVAPMPASVSIPPAPKGVDPVAWTHMTPEERKLFQ